MFIFHITCSCRARILRAVLLAEQLDKGTTLVKITKLLGTTCATLDLLALRPREFAPLPLVVDVIVAAQ